MTKTPLLAAAAILTTQLFVDAAPKEFDGLAPAQVFERLEAAIVSEPATRLRRFVGVRIEFKGADGLGSAPAHVPIRDSETVYHVYLTPSEIRELPPKRLAADFTPSGPIPYGLHVLGTVRAVNKRKKIVEVQSISTKRINLNTQ